MRISLGDVSLWFDVSGPSVIPQGDTTAERPVVVAVHGGPGLDHMTVKSALGPLAGDFQVVYFDLRGHGRSDHSSAEFWNLRTWADDLRRLCDALGLDKPVVLGSSFGGDVVLTYAGLFPDHPGGVILANTTGGRSDQQRPSRGAPTLMRPGTTRLSSPGSATRCTAPRPAGPGNPASSWPG
jgi:pimeloyl-ACP methyl ester carboxylesterase